MNPSKFALTGIACLLSTAATCMAQVSTPVIGVARLGDGSLRMVYGVPDNLIVDSQNLGRVQTASFSDTAALVYKDGSIDLVDRKFHPVGGYSVEDPNALLNVDGDADTAIAWLPGSATILYWNNGAFHSTVVKGLEGSFEVTSLRRSGPQAELLISDPNGPVFEGTVSIETGELTSLIPLNGIHAPAFWARDRILFQDVDGLAVQQPNGAVEVLPGISGNLSFARISSEWVLVTSATAKRSWVVNVSGAHVRMSELPATTAEGVR